MTDNDAPEALPKSPGSKILRFVQWIVFVAVLLFALIALMMIEYRGLRGFPEILFWLSQVCCFGLALAHLPNLFFRLDGRLRIAAYIAILPIFILALATFGQAIDAYHRTPEGAAAKAKQDREDELEAAAETRREAVAQARAEKQARGQKAAERAERDDWLSRNPGSITPQNWSCTNLIPSVIQMSQSRPFQVLEITSPREEMHMPGFSITCNARAEWTNGATYIRYGARLSEGGQIIVTFSQNP